MKRMESPIACGALVLTLGLVTGCEPADAEPEPADVESPAALSSDSSTISTVAGTGAPGSDWGEMSYYASGDLIYVGTDVGGYNGDHRPAVSAQLNWPTGVAIAPNGDVYIADILNDRVRRIDHDGIITTVAGTGEPGFMGDHGPAVLARLDWPGGLAVDDAGNLFIADTGNHAIRKVAPNGIITTVAGNGLEGYAGDGGVAVDAELAYPTGVAVGTDGSLYIADYFNSVIRRVSSGGMISTVAGNGTVGFSGDGGPATLAALGMPGSITVDAQGTLYFTDNCNNRIRRVTPDGIISTIAGSGLEGYDGDGGRATDASLAWPTGIAVNSRGEVFVTDTFNHVVRMISVTGIITTAVGNGYTNDNGLGGLAGDYGAAIRARLNEPYDVTIDRDGALYIADAGNNRIRKVVWPASTPQFAQPDENVQLEQEELPTRSLE
jgi:sugar lactone lactonase YvrE